MPHRDTWTLAAGLSLGFCLFLSGCSAGRRDAAGAKALSPQEAGRMIKSVQGNAHLPENVKQRVIAEIQRRVH